MQQPSIPGMPYPVFQLGQFFGDNCLLNGTPQSGVPMPSAGTLQNLRVTGGDKSQGGEGGVLTIYVNRKSTAITCTIGSSGSCSDTLDAVSVNAGDVVGATWTPGADGSMDMVVALEKQ